MYRVGCDVGGTNTDAAILDVTRLEGESKGVLAAFKTPTTSDVTDGIRTAIEEVLVKSGIDRKKVLNVAIGTTHFVNAVVENDSRRLDRVACIRLCGPYTRSNPPFSDFPYALRDIVEGPHFYLDGGLEIDGREIEPLSPQQIRETADTIVKAGIRAVAIVGVFSALDHEGKHENRCKELIQEAYPHLSVVTSHSIGGPGLLVRENATILNAAILPFARHTIRGFRQAMKQLQLTCPLFLTQNDGTLIEASAAAQLPIKTFASGPTNSLMGAAFLQGRGSVADLKEKQVLVVDVGGTTTDICSLLPSGFPRKAPNFVEVGGVRTAFSMPEVYSIGLGGGSRVRFDSNGNATVGPDSVGYRLTQEALAFGGSTLTASDIMVAAGAANIGDARKVKHLSKEHVRQAIIEIRRLLEKAIDKMKVSASPVFVLLVGGGSVIFPREGMSMQFVEPNHHDSANAIGAAIAKIAGDIDIIEVLAGRDEDAVVEEAKQKAVAAAIAGGANKDDITIAELSKIPLQYVNNKATRLLIKAVGSLTLSSNTKSIANGFPAENEPNGVAVEDEPKSNDLMKIRVGSMANPTLGVDLNTYRPNVCKGIWYVSAVDVELCAVGCGILGTGGGGSPYNVALYVLDIIRKQGEGVIRVISPKALKDNDICVFGSGYGAPSVSDERVKSGEEIPVTIEELNKVLGYDDFQGIVADEIGGGNGIVTFPTSARFKRPVIDCDLMGRAYPTVEHCTPYVYGFPVMPCAIADAKGNVGIVVKAENNTRLEGMLRTTCVELGNAVAVTGKPLNGKIIRDYAIPNTLSQAWFLGRAVHLARQKKIDFIQAIGDVTPVKLLYTGKIVDVSRDVSRGYTVGQCIIAPLSLDEQEDSHGSDVQKETRNLIITFQNEYLIAYHEAVDSGQADKEVLCVVPDLISILGSDGEALGSPDLRYGLQVKVIAMPAHPLWTQGKEALRVGGPEFFNLGVPWKPVGEYKMPKSVIEEFDKDR